MHAMDRKNEKNLFTIMRPAIIIKNYVMVIVTTAFILHYYEACSNNSM